MMKVEGKITDENGAASPCVYYDYGFIELRKEYIAPVLRLMVLIFSISAKVRNMKCLSILNKVRLVTLPGNLILPETKYLNARK